MEMINSFQSIKYKTSQIIFSKCYKNNNKNKFYNRNKVKSVPENQLQKIIQPTSKNNNY